MRMYMEKSASYLDQFPMLLYNVQLQGNNLPLKVYIVSNLVREAVFDHVEPAIRHLEAFPYRKKKDDDRLPSTMTVFLT